MYAAGGHTSQLVKSSEPGMTRCALVASPAVAATNTNAGTARRLANGAIGDTRWKLIATMGSVKAVAATVLTATSDMSLVKGKSSIGGQRGRICFSTSLRGAVITT